MVLINLTEQYHHHRIRLQFPLIRKRFEDLWFAHEIRSGLLSVFIKGNFFDIKTEETILNQDQSEI